MLLYLRQNTYLNPGTVIFQELLVVFTVSTFVGNLVYNQLMRFLQNSMRFQQVFICYYWLILGTIKGIVNIISIVTFHLTRRATPGLTTVDWSRSRMTFSYLTTTTRLIVKQLFYLRNINIYFLELPEYKYSH